MHPRDFHTIIFDLGGVILNIDYHRTIRAFRALGMDDFERHFTQLRQEHLFDLYETGQIGDADFRLGLRSHLRADVTDAEIDDAWNAMLLDLPAARLDLLRELAHGRRLFLLSNTNAIHIDAFGAQLQKAHGLMDLSGFFGRVYLSYQMGIRKPDPAIFTRVCHENGLDPAATLFIDDSPQHVEGARMAGLQAIHLTGSDIIDLFNRPSE
jgi:putative hydrolase of the HAD superfamily